MQVWTFCFVVDLNAINWHLSFLYFFAQWHAFPYYLALLLSCFFTLKKNKSIYHRIFTFFREWSLYQNPILNRCCDNYVPARHRIRWRELLLVMTVTWLKQFFGYFCCFFYEIRKHSFVSLEFKYITRWMTKEMCFIISGVGLWLT